MAPVAEPGPGQRPRPGRGARQGHSLVSQSSPSQPLGQKQRKASTSSMHVPPLWHGWPRQSSMSAGGGREQGPGCRPSPPPPAHSPRPLTLVAVGACEAAVTDAGEVAAGQADAASMGPTHAGGRHAGHPGSCLQPAAVNHCGKGEGSALAPFLQTPPPPRRPCPHLCRPLQGRGPWAQSSSCRPCSQGRRSSSRPPGCSSGRRSSRGSAHRGQCPPAGWGYREDPAAPGRLARSPRGPRHQACIARA